MKGKFKYKESRGLPGGPNEQFTYVTGVFSTEGYKADSPDVNNPFNIIPSGNITMKGVDFPVMGTDNLGNTKAMIPGNDYKFPGDMVFETPMAKYGGGLLTKTMKCNSCGWKWKAADGGNDVSTCHKCGGEALPTAQNGREQATLSAYEEPAWYEKAFDYLASPMTTLGYLATGQDLPYDLPINMEGRNVYDMIIDTVNPLAMVKYAAQAKRDYDNEKYISAGLNTLGALPIVPAVLSKGKNIAKVFNKIPAKVNPNYFTPNSNMYYRGIGREGMQDALEFGAFRAKPSDKIAARMVDLGPNQGKLDLAKRFNKTYYSPRFKTADQYGAGYIAEVPKDAADFVKRYKRSDWSMSTRKQIPIKEGRILEKNWWSGYKPIEAHKFSNGGSLYKAQEGGEYIVKSGDTFDGIANRLGINKDEFIKANPGVRGKTLQINQTLNVPTSKPKEYKTFAGKLAMENLFALDKPFYDEFNKIIEPLKPALEPIETLTAKAIGLDNTGILKSSDESKLSKDLIFNEKFEKYKKDLINQENAAKEGYDPEKKLWFPHEAPEKEGGFDIGYGHKIKKGEDFSKGLTDQQVNDLLTNDLNVKIKSAKNVFDNENLNRKWDELNPEEKILLTDYQYNVGLTNFPKFIKALANKDKETMLEEYLRYSDGEPLGKRNDWTKSYIDTNLNYKTGGQLNDLKIYSDYINGNYDDIKFEKEAQKVYDKLNRIHYKNAKQFGMSAPNYIITYFLKNPNG